MLQSQSLLSPKQNMKVLLFSRLISRGDFSSHINLRPFAISAKLTNFFMANIPTRAFLGMDKEEGSAIIVVLSPSVIDRLFQREERASSIFGEIVFGFIRANRGKVKGLQKILQARQ